LKENGGAITQWMTKKPGGKTKLVSGEARSLLNKDDLRAARPGDRKGNTNWDKEGAGGTKKERYKEPMPGKEEGKGEKEFLIDAEARESDKIKTDNRQVLGSKGGLLF